MLRRIFGLQREVQEDFIMRSFMLHQNTIRVIKLIKSKIMKWALYVARMEIVRNAYKILVRKTELKRPF
jgi:hypothetical protein